MRIGIDIRELEKGKRTGIGRILSGLLNYISLNDTTNEYILFGNQRTEIQKDWKIRVIRERITFIWDQLKLPLALKREKVQIFFSPYFKAPIFAHCPFITMICDLTPLKNSGNVISKFYYAFWGRLCAKLAQKVITLSKYSRQELIKTLHIEKNKIIIVYPSVEIGRLEDWKIERIREKYGIESEFILWVGVMRQSKNLARLIEAYKMLSDEIKDKYALVIAGKKNEYFRVLKNLVDRLGLEDKVLFPGFITDEDLPVLYRSASLFVFPSLYEGFGIPPLEAMACGTPVVVANTTSLPEIIGTAGILVNPLDTDSLTKAMYDVLTNIELRSKMIEKGKILVKKFSVESMSQKLLSELE